jgi:hypothetical protein
VIGQALQFLDMGRSEGQRVAFEFFEHGRPRDSI